MLAALLQLPAPTADLVAVERLIQADISFLERVEKVWTIDDTRVVAYIAGQKQGKYADDAPERGGLAGQIYYHSEYNYLAIYEFGANSPFLLFRGETIGAYPVPHREPVFQRRGDWAVLASQRAGADHYRTCVSAIDLRRNRVRPVFHGKGVFSYVRLEKKAVSVAFSTGGSDGRTAWSGVKLKRFTLE